MGEFAIVRTRNRQLVSQLVRAWHSTHVAPQGWRLAFLLKRGGVTVGVSTFGRPVARLEDQIGTLEHQRMALGPGLPKNTASWFMARTRAKVRRLMPEITRLISYVDEDVHTGVTYRADNWTTVYARQSKSHTWGNRTGRTQGRAGSRTKFERRP